MGKGKALQLAIEDMERLPPEDRLRQLSYQIVNMLRLKLKVNKDELTVVACEDPANLPTSGLGLVGDDGHLRANHRIQQ